MKKIKKKKDTGNVVMNIDKYQKLRKIAKESVKNKNELDYIYSFDFYTNWGLSEHENQELRKENKELILVEKTIIRPTFSYIGHFYINKNAINQIIFFELSKFDYINKINSVKFNNKKGNLEIFIILEVDVFNSIETIVKLQKHLIKSLYSITLMNVISVDIRVNMIKSVK